MKEEIIIHGSDGVDYKKQSPWAILAVCMMGIFIYLNNLPTPGLAAIAAAFPDIDTVTLQQVVTLPGLLTIVGSLAVGPLAKVVNRKILFIVVMVADLVVALLPAIIPIFSVMLICRGAIGIVRGAAMTLTFVFVAAVFAPGADRDKVMGWGMTVGSIGGMAFQTLGGFLANIGWQMPFWGSLVTVPFIIYCWILLPNPGKTPKAEKTKDGKSISGFTGMTWAIMVVGLVAAVFFFSFMTNMSLVVVGTGLGTPAEAGLFMTTFMLGTAFNGLIVKWVKGALKTFYFGTAFLLQGIALFILLNFLTVPMYFVGAFVFGMGFGILNVEINLRISASCAPNARDVALSVYTAANGCGSYFSPFILVPLAAAIGLQGPLAYWVISAPALIVIAVICYVAQIFINRKSQDRENAGNTNEA